jgi:glycosyltransferase involved in cell wall biosynthesis
MLKKICHLTSINQLFDVRIFHRQSLGAIQAGFDVTIIVVHDREESVNGIHVVPFPHYRGRIRRILCAPFKMLRLALQQRDTLFHLHNIELIPTGLALKLLGRQVIYDAHEDSPRDIMEKQWIGPVFIRRILALSVYLLERLANWWFDAIIAATPDIQTNFNPKKTILIGNYPDLTQISAAEKKGTEKGDPVIIYAGTLTAIRGIKELCESMSRVSNARLWLFGEWENDSFRKVCEALDGWRRVVYWGVVPLADVYGYMKVADIGVINFKPLANYLRAMPNKIFEYMASGLPMVLPNFPYWRERFADCALFADSENPLDVAEKINQLLSDASLREKFGSRGKTLAHEKYSWASEERKMIAFYNKILRSED